MNILRRAVSPHAVRRGAILLLLALCAPSAQAQRIQIAVAIDDSAAGRVFQNGFTSAFKSLGDVDVVALTDNPKFVLSGVVLCTPECANVASYTAILRFSQPVNRQSVFSLVDVILPEAKANPSPAEYRTRLRKLDSLTDMYALPALRRYEKTNGSWKLTWGKWAYEAGIREFVRTLDADCLHQFRVLGESCG